MAKGFTFFESYYQAAQSMPRDEQTAFYLGLIEYAFEDKPLESKIPMVNIAFTLVKPTIDKSMQDRENGSDGGRGNKKNNKTKKPPLKAPFESPHKNQKERNGADKDLNMDLDMDLDMDSDNDLDMGAGGEKQTGPPTLEEIKSYCDEHQQLFDMPESAQLAFYNWVIDKGRNCKDWHSRLLQWHLEDKGKGKNINKSSGFSQRNYTQTDFDNIERKKLRDNYEPRRNSGRDFIESIAKGEILLE